MFTSLINRVGTWYRAFNLAVALVRLGHSVSLVKGGTQRIVPERTSERGVTVWTLPRYWGSSAFHRGTRMPLDIAMRALMPRLAAYDVVHSFTHHLNSLLPAVLARWVRPGTVVVGDRDDLWADGGLSGDGAGLGGLAGLDFRFESWTERSMGRWFDAMTVCSDDLQDRVVASGADPARVRKVINGCPIDRITPGDARTARAALGLPADRAIAVFVGVGQYDVDLIFDALLQLKARRPDLPRPLTIFAGPNPEWLRGLAAERGLADEVIATGMLTDPQLLPYLRAADFGLLPFADKPLNWARFPIKIGDYLAAGIAVLTNDVGEMGRIVRETNTGLATKPDAASYAAGMARLLEDRQTLRAYGRAAVDAAQKMRWDAVGAELEAFYLDLGAGNGVRSKPMEH